jgi:hypothetical protein
MTARTPRTTLPPDVCHWCLHSNGGHWRDCIVLVLNAEREVSRALAEACQRARDRMYVHQSAATKEAVQMCDAALAQYTAQSGEDGGRERG